MVKDLSDVHNRGHNFLLKNTYMYVSHLTAPGLVYELPLLVVDLVLSFPEGRRFLKETFFFGNSI